MSHKAKKRHIPLKIFLSLLLVGVIVLTLKPIRIRLFGFPQKNIAVFDETVPFFTESHYDKYPPVERWNPEAEII